MRGSKPFGPPRRWLLTSSAIGVAYFIAGKLGLKLAFVHSSATAVWPPTGIALAALLIFGIRVWPGIAAGAFFANLATAGTVLTSLGIAAGNTLEAIVGAYLVGKFANGSRSFDQPRNVFKFAALAGVLATLISPTVGVTTLVLGGLAPMAKFGSIWLTWWLGDAGGALVVAPALLLWKSDSDGPRRSFIESAALTISVFAVGSWIFYSRAGTSFDGASVDFLSLPLLLWAAFRFSRKHCALVIVALSALAVSGTLRGLGPFAGHSTNDSLLLLVLFMAVASVTTMAVSAAVLAGDRAARSQARLAALVESSDDAIISKSLDHVIETWNSAAETLFGYTAAEAIGLPIAILIPEEKRDEEIALLARIRRGEQVERLETERIRKDGMKIPVSVTLSPIRNEAGRIVGTSKIARDISERRRLEKERSLLQERFQHQAFHDALTGLPNRALFEDRLSLALALAARDSAGLAVMFLDLDNFKPINDTFGHSTGDRLLQAVSNRLRGCVRDNDSIARIGGDEFLLLFPTASTHDDVATIARKLLRQFRRPFDIESRSLPITASIGIAVYPSAGTTIEELLRSADSAMYSAKGSGKNRFRLAGEAASRPPESPDAVSRLH